MSIKILTIGIISLVLQSCGNQSNFSAQKYTKLKFNKNIAGTSDELQVQNDSICITNEIKVNADIHSHPVEEMSAYQHRENSHEVIGDQWIQIKKTEQQQHTNPSISVFKPEKTKLSKKQVYKKGEKFAGWLFYILGIGLILIGIVAPLFATLIGWWLILIAFATIFLGALLMLVGADKIQFTSEEWSWSAVFAFFIGLISFGITCIVSLVVHLI